MQYAEIGRVICLARYLSTLTYGTIVIQAKYAVDINANTKTQTTFIAGKLGQCSK